MITVTLHDLNYFKNCHDECSKAFAFLEIIHGFSYIRRKMMCVYVKKVSSESVQLYFTVGFKSTPIPHVVPK